MLGGGSAWLGSVDPDTGLAAPLGGFATFMGFMYFAFALAIFLPTLAVTIRRMHDQNMSGWMYLIILIPIIGFVFAIYLIVKFCMRGTVGPNQYGPDPLGPNANVFE